MCKTEEYYGIYTDAEKHLDFESLYTGLKI